MKYYPIFLDVKDKDCLVVGGGPVGARKAETLEKCGASVTLISDRHSPSVEGLKQGAVCIKIKSYEKEDAEGRFLVFAATHNADLNAQIKKDAAALNILCNVADAPENSDFVLPSIVDRKELIVAISTSGSSPAMAKKIRQDLEKHFGPEYAQFLALMGTIRKRLLSSGHAPDDHKKIFYALIEKGLLGLIRANDDIKINAVLQDVLGKEYQYQDLVSTGSDE
ncbi:MAG: bifunctional precorrin-2 dehydrogenase/sirohydrochlorin ferrochelatase [Proteobacteria bacterium]|nr:bifunctional precorrin-2 dehydrogenase/sirohydrochlorin ferrochelatase [Pseudomonadota bacterium]MBU1582371.1 bifunctional precorrin-2 dehydrogenase/sirohydrochlorin ferrochelatase [Pseudomonadota bacterium]MBU2628911.1 bifunctional precorrin-2 dehydrogenase/sirohydrochlorin ferrochelatase [Pseudomonadota bacterium]